MSLTSIRIQQLWSQAGVWPDVLSETYPSRNMFCSSFFRVMLPPKRQTYACNCFLAVRLITSKVAIRAINWRNATVLAITASLSLNPQPSYQCWLALFSADSVFSLDCSAGNSLMTKGACSVPRFSELDNSANTMPSKRNLMRSQSPFRKYLSSPGVSITTESGPWIFAQKGPRLLA